LEYFALFADTTDRQKSNQFLITACVLSSEKCTEIRYGLRLAMSDYTIQRALLHVV